MTRCLAPDCQMGGLGCDNMTVVLVCFLNGKPYKELCSKCSIPSIANVRTLEENPQENGNNSSSEGYTSDEPSNDSSTSPSSTPDSLTTDPEPVQVDKNVDTIEDKENIDGKEAESDILSPSIPVPDPVIVA